MDVVLEPNIEEHDPRLYKEDFEAVKYNGWNEVDSQALRQYEEKGYLIICSAFSQEVINAARKELESMLYSEKPDCESVYYEGGIRKHLEKVVNTDRSDEAGENKSHKPLAIGKLCSNIPQLESKLRAHYVRKFMRFIPTHKPLAKLAAYQPLLTLIKKICKSHTVELFQDMAMIKPPGGREKPWHQDHAYFNHPLGTRIVGVWIALSKVTKENGVMYLIPGAHNNGPIPHFKRRDWQICDDDIYKELKGRRTSAPMNPGDVLIFDSKLPHGTPKNVTKSYRWAVQLHYRPEDSESFSEEDRLSIFGSEGKNVTC